MSLLRDIQDAAIDSKTDLSTLLRKCMVLASRLGSLDFKQWIENELNGYASGDELPLYRIITTNSKGHFSGGFGSGLRNADIPLSCIPAKFRKALKSAFLTQSVATLEALVANAKNGTAQEPWSPDLVAYVGQGIYENMNCMQAWKVIPITSIVAVLDAIRNKILNFVLEIEAEAPDAGEGAVNSNPVPKERVHQMFTTIITGNVQNLANGNERVTQSSTYTEGQSDELFGKILDAISKSGEDAKLISELVRQIEALRSSKDTPSFGEHYINFMATLADHITVLGPIISPYLPALSAFLH
jgi:hypothetical protein